jgi:hypothetical protein
MPVPTRRSGFADSQAAREGEFCDLTTPFHAAFYAFKPLPIPSGLGGNVLFAWYEAGDMVYVHDESLKKLHDEVAAFIRSTQAGSQ